MCDNNSGDRAEYPAQRFGDRRLGVDVECGQGVVEHQNARPRQNRSGQRQPLTLSAGQAHPLLADAGLQSEWQLVDERGSGDLDGAVDLGIGGRILAGAAQREVFGNRHRKEDRILERNGHLAPEGVQRQIANVHAADPNVSFGDVVETWQQGRQDRLTGSGRADQSQRLARFDSDADMTQHPGARGRPVRKPEAHIVELQQCAARRFGPGAVGDLEFRVEDLGNAIGRGHRLLGHRQQETQ